MAKKWYNKPYPPFNGVPDTLSTSYSQKLHWLGLKRSGQMKGSSTYRVCFSQTENSTQQIKLKVGSKREFHWTLQWASCLTNCSINCIHVSEAHCLRPVRVKKENRARMWPVISTNQILLSVIQWLVQGDVDMQVYYSAFWLMCKYSWMLGVLMYLPAY